MSRTLVVPLWLAAAGLALGCGGGGGSDAGTPPSTTAIAKTSTNSGDAQGGTVGQALGNPLRVLVTEGGTPSSGVTVTWLTTATGSSLNPASSITDAEGIASETWTLGTASGTQAAEARLSGATGSPVAFSATAAPGAATTLSKASGDNQTGDVNTQLALPVQAKVQDQFGNGVAAVSVTWAAVGGAVSSGSVPSNAAGISPVQVTLGGTAGPVIITATAAGLTGSPLAFNATAVVPPPLPTQAAVSVANISFSSGQNGTSNPAVDTIAVGGTVTWTWNNTGTTTHSVESLGLPHFTSSPIQSGNGTTHKFTFTTAGTYQYDCAVHGPLMTGRVVVR
jgi:plastocyanin